MLIPTSWRQLFRAMPWIESNAKTFQAELVSRLTSLSIKESKTRLKRVAEVLWTRLVDDIRKNQRSSSNLDTTAEKSRSLGRLQGG